MPLQFFRSSAAPCPYLPGRIERKLFARLGTSDGVTINSRLSHAGFRRSHDIIYKPACPGCNACVPVRVPVKSFTPTGTLSRILRRSADLAVSEELCSATREQFDLFISYEAQRHTDSDMARMSYDDYVAMLQEGQADTSLLALRDSQQKLTGIMLADRLDDGFSAVYSFYETSPDWQRASLGTLLILRLIEQARLKNLPYVYLGYWVQQSRKMDYKARFKPLEALGPGGWQPFSLNQEHS